MINSLNKPNNETHDEKFKILLQAPNVLCWLGSKNEWSHFRGLYMESKVIKLCITQGLSLGVKGLMNHTVGCYFCSRRHNGDVSGRYGSTI